MFQAICEESICDDIDIPNAVQYLILGYLHEAKNLKDVALDYVSNNLVGLSSSQLLIVIEIIPSGTCKIIFHYPEKLYFKK